MSTGFKKENKVARYPKSIIAFGQRFEPTTWYISVFMLGFVAYALSTRQQYWSIAIPVIMLLISAWLGRKQLRHWQNSWPKVERGDDAPDIIMDKHSTARRMSIGRLMEERAMAPYYINSDLTWGEYLRRKIQLRGIMQVTTEIQVHLETLDGFRVRGGDDPSEDPAFIEASAAVRLFLDRHVLEVYRLKPDREQDPLAEAILRSIYSDKQ